MSKRLPLSKIATLALKLVMTLGVFWLAFRGIALSDLKEAWQEQHPGALVIALGFLLIQLFLGAFRWDFVLHAFMSRAHTHLAKPLIIKIYYISIFFTTCLPGAVGGDMIRIWLTKSEHVPLHVSANSVVIDRMIALVALFIMVMISLPLLGQTMGGDIVAMAAITVMLTGLGLWVVFKADTLLTPFKHIRVVHGFLHFFAGLRVVLQRPLFCVAMLGMAVLGHVMYSLAAWALAQSLSLPMTIIQSIMLMPPVILATSLPISIGGWGVREMGVIGMLGLIGISKTSALMLSLQLGFLLIILTLPGSVLWLLHRKKHPQSMAPSLAQDTLHPL